MWYWNQDNFEGLDQIASHAAQDERLVEFAKYCRFRSQGLRRQSLGVLDAFVRKVLAWPEHEQWQFVDWLWRTQLRSPSVHQLIPHPLMTRVVLPVLHRWVSAEPNNATPYRWLGFATRDMSHFRNAVEIDGSDDIARTAIIEGIVGQIDYSCHHLPEFFIGSPQEMLEIADEAARLVIGLRDAQTATRLDAELKHARQQVVDWLEFQGSGEHDFDEWCARRGHKYERSVTYWYKS